METATLPSPRISTDHLSPAAIERIRTSQARWARQSMRQRLQVIHRLRTLLPSMSQDFCQAVHDDIHKPISESLGAELLPLAAACKFLENRASKILRPRRASWRDTPIWLFGERDQIVRKPHGIVGIIGTWNYPFFLNGVQIAQALAAGNAVIWKPSEVTPRSAAVLTQWMRKAGVTTDLVTVLPAEREWGSKLVEAPLDYLIFTGHDVTGRKLAARLGERLIPSTLELSGHDAMVVLEDANLALAARAVFFGVTVNAGQTCVATRRIFVARKIYSAFLDQVKQLFENASAPRPLAQAFQAQHVNRIIEEAVNQGARVLVGAAPRSGASYSPIILADVHPDMQISREALFAPVAAILPFEELNEAIAGIKVCDYGLGLSLFTANHSMAMQLATELPAGLVTINDAIAPLAHPATPFGGVGKSGWGVTQGQEGLLEMTVPQVIGARIGSWRPHFDAPGSSFATDADVLQAMLRWQHGPRWRLRVRGFFGLLGAFRRSLRKAK